jgi:O-antigen biosynthesis protein
VFCAQRPGEDEAGAIDRSGSSAVTVGAPIGQIALDHHAATDASRNGGSHPRAVPTTGIRPSARGKFIFLGDTKLYVRGVTYGTFARGAEGDLYPSPEVVRADLARMAKNGINAIRTYTRPPRWLLDVALEQRIWVMAGTAWEQHVDFLADRARARSIERRVRADVEACAGHPAVLCHAIANEIPARVVRWIGRRRVERFIERLERAARSEDPGGLVTYVNYPTTEYLQTPGSDLACFNVYLESPDRYEAYLARLQNLAGDKPLVMTELGLDSRAHGKQRQAETLAWQVRGAFSAGCAGTFVFSWTDEWHVSYLSETGRSNGSAEMLDWDFGLTDRDRRPKPALSSVRAAYTQAPFASARRWPRVTVVVCTFNGGRTLDRCLAGVERLDYPDMEAIVVDDGSTDDSAAIAERHGCRLISTPNRGLASARNTGMRAASGEIVAYLDDDAVPDRDWLRYLVATIEEHGFAGAGGPNLPPTAGDIVARCVGESPGGPMHVLLSDREAEHLPGCNMAFRKASLERIGGFDPQFRVAGDDVDICWRLRNDEGRLGFSPAAVVWHEPRGSVRTFLRQQRGYGAAEALLERKWPNHYGPRGHARWRGRLYGRGLRSGLGRDRIYFGTWGSQPFQALYGPAPGRLAGLGSLPEWYLAVAAFFATALAGLWWAPLEAALPLLAAALLAWLVPAALSARRARFMHERLPRARKLGMWSLTTLLYLAQPLARLRGRMRTPPWRPANAPAPVLPRRRSTSVWSERWRAADERLAAIEQVARREGAAVFAGGSWDHWDLHLRGGLVGAARLRMGVEEHGGGRQLVRIEVTPYVSVPVAGIVSAVVVAAVAATLVGAWQSAIVLAAAVVAATARIAWEAAVATAWLEHAASGAQTATVPDAGTSLATEPA